VRTGYDSTRATDIPSNAAVVAGYVDGLYAWSAADWARFPTAVKIRVAVFSSTNDGHVADVENGNMSPQQSVGWVLMRRAAGIDPTVYCNYSTWSEVRQAFQAAGVPEPHYWIALWDGVATFISGAVAKQYANPTFTGQHFDLSAAWDVWPGVDTQPTPIVIYPPGPVASSATLGLVALLAGAALVALAARREPAVFKKILVIGERPRPEPSVTLLAPPREVLLQPRE